MYFSLYIAGISYLFLMPRSKHSFERDSPWGCPISNKFALRSVVEFIETTTFSVAVISTSSMSATLITFGTAPSLSRPAPYLCKNHFKASSYKRLNKKELCKEGKRKIKAHEVLQILFILFIQFTINRYMVAEFLFIILWNF